MKRTSKTVKSNLLVILALTGFLGSTQIQSAKAAEPGDFSVDDNFQRGWHEATFGAGAMFSNIVRKNNRPNIDYAMGYAQLGYIVTQPGSGGFFRGSLELAPEIFGAGVYSGPGHYVVGGTLWFRYNFVQPGWRIVPYLQGGGGGTALDIPDRFDGKMFNWNLEAAVGLRYFVQPKCSLNLEYRLQHISNANMWSHNVGVNTDGPFVGVSLFF